MHLCADSLIARSGEERGYVFSLETFSFLRIANDLRPLPERFRDGRQAFEAGLLTRKNLTEDNQFPYSSRYFVADHFTPTAGFVGERLAVEILIADRMAG
jgi:hypothetical protein